MVCASAGRALVIGGDSRIGSAVAATLQHRGWTVTLSTRRPVGGADRLFLDLASPDFSDALPEADICLIAAARARVADCRTDPVGARRVNVDAPALLAERLARHRTHVLFLSSNQVFDGSRPRPKPAETTCPISDYGRQKAEAEAAMLAAGPDTAVLRLTKVLEDSSPLFLGWHDTLRAGLPIHPFTDMVFAPVSLAAAAAAAAGILERRLSGIFHLSGDADISYAAAAARLATRLGAAETLVQPVPSSASGYADPVPTHTTLNDDALRALVPLPTASSTCTLDAAFASLLHRFATGDH